jgi:hypothetical protein
MIQAARLRNFPLAGNDPLPTVVELTGAAVMQR